MGVLVGRTLKRDAQRRQGSRGANRSEGRGAGQAGGGGGVCLVTSRGRLPVQDSFVGFQDWAGAGGKRTKEKPSGGGGGWNPYADTPEWPDLLPSASGCWEHLGARSARLVNT